MADMTYACNYVALESSERTSTGLQPNVAGALSYLLGWVTGIFFLIFERENKFVRFHAIQSIVVFGAVTVAGIALSFIPVAGWMLNLLIGFGAFVLWIVLVVRASLGETCTVPLAAGIARRQLKSED